MRTFSGVWILSLYVNQVINVKEGLGLLCRSALLSRKQNSSAQNQKSFCNKLFSRVQWTWHQGTECWRSPSRVGRALYTNIKITKTQCLQDLFTANIP